MIRLLKGMPTGVLGLEAIDDVEKEDYENVIIPAINAAIAGAPGRYASSTSSAPSSTTMRERRSGRT